MLDLQSEEILFSNNELEKKFRDLETKIEQLSLLSDLGRRRQRHARPREVYEQALQRLVHRMGYQAAHLFLVDPARAGLRGHRMAVGTAADGEFVGASSRWTPGAVRAPGGAHRPARHVDDVDTDAQPLHRADPARSPCRSFIAVPLRVKDRRLRCAASCRASPTASPRADVELMAAVANHVALAVDRAESF